MQQDKDSPSYLIPRNVVVRFEFFPGYSWKEAFHFILAAAAGVFVYWFMGLFTQSIFRFFIALFLPVLVAFVYKPQPDGSTLMGHLVAFYKWWRGQKLFIYKYKGGAAE